MTNMSQCIFEWDTADYNLLVSTKQGEIIAAGVPPTPSLGSVKKSVVWEELSRHCKRCTQGTTETTDLLEVMLLAMSQVTDSLGVPP